MSPSEFYMLIIYGAVPLLLFVFGLIIGLLM